MYSKVQMKILKKNYIPLSQLANESNMYRNSQSVDLSKIFCKLLQHARVYDLCPITKVQV